jgi:hypothetical protein
MPSPLSPLILPQRADEHRSEDTILLAVDQQLAESPVFGALARVIWMSATSRSDTLTAVRK